MVEFGPEIWGVEAASRTYYGHPADRLTVEQAASLAASLPFPLKANPGYRPGRLRWRRDLVLRLMRGEPVKLPADSDSVDVKSPAPDSIPEIPPP